MIRVILPHHLQMLANTAREVRIEVSEPVTVRSILNALEAAYPAVCGAIREHNTGRRRSLVRFLACGEDISQLPFDEPLPPAVGLSQEPFVILGAIAGG